MRQGLDDLEVYKNALQIGELVWNVVLKWEWFAKKTVGAQYVEAADSISANIAEGYGRFFFKENRQFCFYSRGSLLETKNWTEKAKNRNLITEEEYQNLIEKLRITHKMLNSYINYIEKTMQDEKK
jgi:four helix bundle protein